jgi:hypothetical protein
MSTHDHVPNLMAIRDAADPVDHSTGARAFCLYIAVLLIGQRTPEELATLADYLMTGTISEWRNG